MKRLWLSLAVFLPAAGAFAGAPRFDPCSLLARDEIESVQGDRLASTKSSEPQRDRFAVSQCFYTMKTFSKSVSLEVTRRRPQDARGPREQWKQMFAKALEKSKEKEAEEREERAAAGPRRIEGVGDEA